MMAEKIKPAASRERVAPQDSTDKMNETGHPR